MAHFDGHDSGVSSGISARSSLASDDSAFETVEENGRTYPKHGDYLFPYDDAEKERLDLQHKVWLLTFEGKLGLCPKIDEMAHRVLDLGTGTGIWAWEYARNHGGAAVVGVDMHPINRGAPVILPNLKYRLQSLEGEWAWVEHCSLTFMRGTNGCFGDMRSMLDEAWDYLEPGGWVELQDMDYRFESDDGTLPKDLELSKVGHLLVEASHRAGRSMIHPPLFKTYLDEHGRFIDVVEKTFKWPLNDWPKDETAKKIGRLTCENLDRGLEGLLLRPLMRYLNWSKDDVVAFCNRARAQLKDRNIHAYMPIVLDWISLGLEAVDFFCLAVGCIKSAVATIASLEVVKIGCGSLRKAQIYSHSKSRVNVDSPETLLSKSTSLLCTDKDSSAGCLVGFHLDIKLRSPKTVFIQGEKLPTTSEAEIGNPSWYQHLAQEDTPRRPNVDAISAAAIDISQRVTLDAVRNPSVRECKQTAMCEKGLPMTITYIECVTAIGQRAANLIRISYVHRRAIGREADAVGPSKAICHSSDTSTRRIVAIHGVGQTRARAVPLIMPISKSEKGTRTYTPVLYFSHISFKAYNASPTMAWKATNRHLQILKAAEEGEYGVLAAIAYNIEQILGLVRAAEQARSPLILQFFPWAIKFSDGLLIRTAADAARRASVPISVHLDHAQAEEIIQLAADSLPFDSIMVDMSHYDKEVNLEKTAKWVRYCNARQIATEAEPGRIEGGEDGVMDTAGLEASKTTTEEVDEFIATGVDALAPAFGNVHGEYGPQGPQLDFERFALIKARLDKRARIALHGTNGFSPDLMRKCIQAGATKINVNRAVLDDYYAHLRSNASTMKSQTSLMEEGVEKVVNQTMEWMEVISSAGKA
ncbi:hypothetical protein AK830_g145 [Neonectria ditissima]|uniref:Fructose-bisphosphate aldolase n=1 Tax=Neonectria ditissima TaxID=78410 RepID=A0A0P7BQJ3_9HYPO|nr:hypothetical protein AK830_g145 [Neonectria ditissima]